MTETADLFIDEISTFGATENGEQVRMTFVLKGGSERPIFVPLGLFPGLTASLMAAGRIQLGRLGSEDALLNAFPVAPFRPTGYLPARGRDESTGEDVVLLRLKKDRVPVLDLVFGFPQAK